MGIEKAAGAISGVPRVTALAPSVAGRFYPSDAAELRAMVRDFIGQPTPRAVRALIAPHAGYVYSGPIAGSAYRLLDTHFRRVLLLGPAHFYPLSGIATHSADSFATPLGSVPVERSVATLDAAFENEHSLEVHLPFLQETLGEFTIVPLLVGDATPEQVATAIEQAGIDDDTLIVVSSDLTHFLDYETARNHDRNTANNIESLRYEEIGPFEACGCRSIAGLLEVARRRDWSVETLDLRNSGDTEGDRDRVVGYGAFVLA